MTPIAGEELLTAYTSAHGFGLQFCSNCGLMNNVDIPIIGLGQRNAEFAHLPLQSMPHTQVADVAASVQRALDLGGSATHTR